MHPASTPFDATAMLASVAGLSNAELGTHLRLTAYVVGAGALPADPLAIGQIARAVSPEDQAALDFVLATFFVLASDRGDRYVPISRAVAPANRNSGVAH